MIVIDQSVSSTLKSNVRESLWVIKVFNDLLPLINSDW